MIDELLYQRLKNNAGVSQIVVSGSTTRIYHIQLPQSPTFPAVSLQRVSSGGRGLSHNGHTQSARPTFQVTCFAQSAKVMRELANAVIAALHGWSDAGSNPRVFSAEVINDTDLSDTETGVFMTAIDVEIFHAELYLT